MSGFAVAAEAHLPEIGALARLHHHPSGGAVLTLRGGDLHALSLGIRTPLPDDSGIAHVLEHCVLQGSRRFPLRRGFAALLDGALHGHLNAATLPGLTVYEIACAHDREFDRLADIWLDAAFDPLLRADAFAREGWRLALDPPRLTGVVLNEMLGHRATPRALGDAIRSALFPGAAQGFDPGGDPARLPDLGLAAMRRYHARHYRAAATLAVIAGPDPEARLPMLARAFDAAPGRVPPAPATPSRWTEPRRRIAAGGPAPAAIAWWLRGATGAEAALLAETLLGTSTSPLRRALADAGFAAEPLLEPIDFEADQPVLRIALPDIAPDRVAAFEACLLAAIARLSRGLDLGDLHAARTRFVLRHGLAEDTHRPAPLLRGLAALRGWRDGGDPIAALRQVGCADPARLAALLATALRDNPHRVTLTYEATDPSPALAARAQAMAADPAARRRARRRAATMDRPERPGARAALGAPTCADWPRDAPERPAHLIRIGPAEALSMPREGGLVQLDLGFDLAQLTASDLPLAGLLAEALRHAAPLGITAETRAAPRPNGGPVAQFWLRGTAPVADAPELVAALLALRTSPLPDPAPLAAARAARHLAHLTGQGHEAADLMLRAQMGAAGATEAALTAPVSADATRLAALRDQLLGTRPFCALSGPAATLDALHDALARTVAEGAPPSPARPAPPCLGPVRLALPVAAATVARGLDLGPQPGSVAAAAQRLATGWLWPNVRDRIGAYGAQARLDPVTGHLRLISIRDPGIEATLAVFAEAPDWLDRAEGIERGIVPALAMLDRPLPWREEIISRAMAHLAGDFAAPRRRVELIAAGARALPELAAAMRAAAHQPHLVVIAPG
ncbi:insulinase family protein [Limimaricola variabilis]|uniref:insulinase family protein n=1 Tax=Limimaricola variabilis TaxID=1492771 RepID=UPI002AC8FCAF|nr:insulinase family protein [Limimaricola variabilis]WPY94972.1 insulinase family protein [Limimaricola variabilis]